MIQGEKLRERRGPYCTLTGGVLKRSDRGLADVAFHLHVPIGEVERNTANNSFISLRILGNQTGRISVNETAVRLLLQKETANVLTYFSGKVL